MDKEHLRAIALEYIGKEDSPYCASVIDREIQYCDSVLDHVNELASEKNGVDIARPTGIVTQDDETWKTDGFDPDRDQLFFHLSTGEGEFAIGLKDILACLSLAEKMKAVLPIGNTWWNETVNRYGRDIEVTDWEETSNAESVIADD